MISEKMKPLVNNNSAIRAMFEEGKRLAAIHGAENVYDFSLGNPNVPAPAEVNQAICKVRPLRPSRAFQTASISTQSSRPLWMPEPYSAVSAFPA